MITNLDAREQRHRKARTKTNKLWKSAQAAERKARVAMVAYEAAEEAEVKLENAFVAGCFGVRIKDLPKALGLNLTSEPAHPASRQDAGKRTGKDARAPDHNP